MAAAALALILNGQTVAEFNNDINQLEAKDVVKDFKSTDGPTHFSGSSKGAKSNDTRVQYVEYKRRLKGALRRANAGYRYLFSDSQNCELSIAHVDALPTGISREFLYDILSMTCAKTALGIVIKHEADLRGDLALKELDARYITGSYKERSDIKNQILSVNFGRDDPEEKLQELQVLMEMRSRQLGSYDDSERISDLIFILEKTPEYKQFLQTHNFVASAGTVLTIDQFIVAITDYWRDTIQTSESKKVATAGGADETGTADSGAKGKGSGKGKGKGKGGKGSKGKGKGKGNGWNNGNYSLQMANAGGATQTGGGRGLSGTTVEDDPRCKWTCPICGPMESTNEWTEGKMHFPDKCPVRVAMRTNFQNANRQSPLPAANPSETAGAVQPGTTEGEIVFDALGGMMMGAEDSEIQEESDEICHECDEDDQISDKTKKVEQEEMEMATNLSLYGSPFTPSHLISDSDSDDGENEDEICFSNYEVPVPKRQMWKSTNEMLIMFLTLLLSGVYSLPDLGKAVLSNAFLRAPNIMSRGIFGYFISVTLMICILVSSILFAGAITSSSGVAKFTSDYADYMAGAPTKLDHWLMDSGATYNLGCVRENFVTLDTSAPKKQFKVAATGLLESEGLGTVKLPLWNRTHQRYDDVMFNNVYYCSKQPLNLLSVRQLLNAGFCSPDFDSLTMRRRNSDDVYTFEDTGTAYIVRGKEADGKAAPLIYKADKIYKTTDNWMLDSVLLQKNRLKVSQPEEQWTELFAGENNYQDAKHYTEDNSFENCTFGPGNYYANPPFKNAMFHNLFQTIERNFDHSIDQKFMIIAPKIPTASWSTYLSKYEVLEEIPEGATIFSIHKNETYNPEVLTSCPPEKCNNHQGRVFIQGTPWPVQILYRDKHTTAKPNKYDLWHAVHGHPGTEMSQQLLYQNPTASRNGDIKPEIIAKCQHGEHCSVCRLYKRTQSSFSSLDSARREELQTFGKLHADLIELPVESVDGCKYFATYTCAKTGYVFGQALQRKSDVVFTTEEILYRIKSMGYKPKTLTLRTDDENVFVAGAHKDFCTKHSLILEHSPPYQKQSAGQAENTNKLIETIARTLMATTAFPVVYWPLAYRHAVVLKNTRPSSTRNWTIPYKAVTGKHYPDDRLHLFGAPAAQFLHPKQRNVGKWGFTAKEGLYVGPTPDSNGNYLLTPESGKIW